MYMIKSIQLAIIQAFTALSDKIRANGDHLNFVEKQSLMIIFRMTRGKNILKS